MAFRNMMKQAAFDQPYLLAELYGNFELHCATKILHRLRVLLPPTGCCRSGFPALCIRFELTIIRLLMNWVHVAEK